jgi:dipeptidyl aminopeptidase/acylaminoacyl peptidase
MRSHGQEKFYADTSKIAVFGGSAGGYLALTAGFRVDPPPTVIVAYWGYGDLVTEWMTAPSPHAGHKTRGPISAKEMAAIEAGPPVANAKDRELDAGPYYATTRQMGVWSEKVSGFSEKNVEKFSPYMAVENVSSAYPPTLMIHGTEDTDVPHEQSGMMAREFEKYGVPFEFISVEGGEHGLRDAKKEAIEAAHAKVVPFVLKWMK